MSLAARAPSCVKVSRRAIAAALLAGNTAAGTRVTTNRAEAIWRTGLPAIEVYVQDEDVELSNEAPREYRRTVRIAVEVYVEEKELAGVRILADDQLDDVVAEIHNILWASHTAWETAGDFTFTGAEYGFSAAGTRLSGACRLTYEAVLYQEAPEGELGRPLNIAHADWDLSGSGVPIDATDDIALAGG